MLTFRADVRVLCVNALESDTGFEMTFTRYYFIISVFFFVFFTQPIEGFTVADVILVVGQTRQNVQ